MCPVAIERYRRPYMEIVKLSVPGISCEHCERAIDGAVGALPGVRNVSVDIPGKTVSVEFDAALVSLDSVRSAIEDQGYEIA
jgi:copper chaperone